MSYDIILLVWHKEACGMKSADSYPDPIDWHITYNKGKKKDLLVCIVHIVFRLIQSFRNII